MQITTPAASSAVFFGPVLNLARYDEFSRGYMPQEGTSVLIPLALETLN